MRVVVAALLLALFTAAAQACPDIGLGGSQLRYTGADLWAPKTFNVVAGGSQNLDRCSLRGAPEATGFVAQAPDFELYYTGGSGYALELRVDSRCDATLLINTAAGAWFFDDDSNGAMDPLIRLSQASEGWYDIWIGTYGADACNASLTLETF